MRPHMTIHYLGQACLLIVYGKIRLLCDPWFSHDAHLGGWEPFPRYEGAHKTHALDLARTATHVYLSHHHEDHFDPQTLREIGPRPIIMGAFRHTGFRQQARALASRLIEIENGQCYTLGKMRIRIHAETPSYRTNSVLEIDTPCGKIVNANDCGLDASVLQDIAARGKVALFFSTLNVLANGWPFPYLRQNESDYAVRVAAVREQVREAFALGMKILKPTVSVAFAGPVSFLHPLSAHLNSWPEARDWRQLVRELRVHGPVTWPAPGSTFSLDTRDIIVADQVPWPVSNPPRQNASSANIPAPVDSAVLRSALENFAKTRRGLAKVLGREPRTALILRGAQDTDSLLKNEYAWRYTLWFNQVAEAVRTEIETDSEMPHLLIESDEHRLLAWLLGQADYDSLLLSGTARFTRWPDTFDNDLHELLRFGDDPGTRKALVQHAKNRQQNHVPDWQVVQQVPQGDSPPVQIARRCPHEGALLPPTPELRDGHPCIVCPRHGWAFRLEDGACVQGDPRVRLPIKHS